MWVCISVYAWVCMNVYTHVHVAICIARADANAWCGPAYPASHQGHNPKSVRQPKNHEDSQPLRGHWLPLSPLCCHGYHSWPTLLLPPKDLDLRLFLNQVALPVTPGKRGDGYLLPWATVFRLPPPQVL